MTTSSLLFKGIDVVLEFLNINKILFGIVTNKPYKYAKPIIDNFIELNNSKILICPDNLKNIKPDPEGVLLACSKLNINPSETIYIGDHQKDLEAGLNAGCKVIGCRYGYSINENTNTYNADLINTPEEIISLIE
jgi:phosphoglycolate phosphatase